MDKTVTGSPKFISLSRGTGLIITTIIVKKTMSIKIIKIIIIMVVVVDIIYIVNFDD